MVSQAFRSLILLSQGFSVCPSIVICFPLQRLFTRELVEVGRGKNKDSPTLKLLHVFSLVCKAGDELVRWNNQESQNNSGFGHQQSVFPYGKTRVYAAGKQEPELVGRRSQCAALQGLQSFRGLLSACYTPASGWLLCQAQDPRKQQESGAVGVWGGKRALWWPRVLGMSPLPVLGLEQESCLCPHQGMLSWIYLDC